MLVALEQNTVVGFAAFGPAELAGDEQPDPGRARRPRWSTLLVEPRWGRRGHGSRLLAAVADLARRDGGARPAGLAAGGRHGVRRVSTSRPAGRPTAGPARWTRGDEPLREIRWHALLDGSTARGTAVSFEGFPDEGLVFYEGLEADNTKTYWTRTRPTTTST